MSERSFWIVWCPRGPKPPSHRHATEGDATSEAVRLAHLNPGLEFFVLEACKVVVKQTSMIRDLERDNIPF